MPCGPSTAARSNPCRSTKASRAARRTRTPRAGYRSFATRVRRDRSRSAVGITPVYRPRWSLFLPSRNVFGRACFGIRYDRFLRRSRIDGPVRCGAPRRPASPGRRRSPRRVMRISATDHNRLVVLRLSTSICALLGMAGDASRGPSRAPARRRVGRTENSWRPVEVKVIDLGLRFHHVSVRDVSERAHFYRDSSAWKEGITFGGFIGWSLHVGNDVRLGRRAGGSYRANRAARRSGSTTCRRPATASEPAERPRATCTSSLLACPALRGPRRQSLRRAPAQAAPRNAAA